VGTPQSHFWPRSRRHERAALPIPTGGKPSGGHQLRSWYLNGREQPTSGWPCPALSNLYNRLHDSIVIPFALPTLMAFNAMPSGGILDRHPNPRVGFFELGSQ
jgi:hypothetical protein